MDHRISIIIPVLNEAALIGRLLKYLLANASKKTIAEIIIVDGNSTDNTVTIVEHFVTSEDFNIKLITCEKGRSRQMNFGARHALGGVLYFLHADSFPPKHFDALILDEVQKGNEAGCFRMEFDSDHWWLKLAGWLTQFRWRACRGGDQSLFVNKTLFNAIGGYDEDFMIYEDYILINALYARKQFVVIGKKLKTSARMYRKHGIWKLQYFYWNIYVKRWLGADADTLYNYYKKWIC